MSCSRLSAQHSTKDFDSVRKNFQKQKQFRHSANVGKPAIRFGNAAESAALPRRFSFLLESTNLAPRPTRPSNGCNGHGSNSAVVTRWLRRDEGGTPKKVASSRPEHTTSFTFGRKIRFRDDKSAFRHKASMFVEPSIRPGKTRLGQKRPLKWKLDATSMPRLPW